MGIFDNLKNVLGGKKDVSIAGATKAPSQVLKENGIDPGGLKFAFGSDGTVTVSGTVKQEADKARIKQVLEGVPGIKKIRQDVTVAPATATPAAEATEKPLAGPAASTSPEQSTEPSPAEPTHAAHSATTYTVQPGDTLWKIAKQFYGEGSKYMKIFEANQNILKNPDHILPGQELVIPEK